MRQTIGLLALLSCALWSAAAMGQTYRYTWTQSSDFAQGAQINVNTNDVPDQLQLNLNQIETPYLWVSNTSSHSVSRIDTSTGRVLSVTNLPPGTSPGRTAVDLNFNCWVGSRAPEGFASTGKAYKLSAENGSILGSTPYSGLLTRGVAINAAGEVWISNSEEDGRGFGWMKVDPDTFQPLHAFQNNLGSYGLAIDPYNHIFSTTSWLGGSSIQRLHGSTGETEQTWNINGLGGNVYGITVDIHGDAWGAIWPSGTVVWVDGDYQCPDGETTCTITEGDGIHREIDVSPMIDALGGSGRYAGRGIGVDANGFVWAVFNDVENGVTTWPSSPSYVVKIDGTTGEAIQATEVGIAAVGITADADGFIWAVNYGGGGQNYQDFDCPNGFEGREGGTVSKIRSSDGSVVATYPSCHEGPYTYSDMAGYNLRSVTLRSGTWRATHDSGRDNLEWGRIDWSSQEFDDTTFRVHVRAANSPEALAGASFMEYRNGDALPLQGRYLEVEVFFFTRNDFLGPVLEDLTVSSVCIPEPESCDGFDNDCDGVIDNGNPGGGTGCETGLDGICATGQRVCTRGRFECRPVLEPVAETCDGQDNNCNGIVDEGVQNLCGACGPVPEEICNGVDDDCDTLVDEGVANACGECGPVPEEVCNGVDDDCDGLVDEGVSNACGGCGSVPEEVCNGIDDDCDGFVDEEVANACGNCGPTPTEICNGEDDDCDGLVDENLINACGNCGPPPIELCDGADNDCDGDIDENVTNACGFCGPLPNEICDGTDNDCDGDIDEGLTNACGGCGPVPEEVCNGIDDDCDGDIDEGVTNACGGCGLVPEEICDGQDNDCDGTIDENVTNACGVCGDPLPDVCDGEDNDCDDTIDEDAACDALQVCIEGTCANACAAGECPRGFYCNEDDYCLVDRCIGVQCPEGQRCADGSCQEENEILCQNVECEGDKVCIGGACQDDPCDTTTCAEGESCWLGECLPEAQASCRQNPCPAGEICDETGACQPDPCQGVQCDGSEVCVEGACEDACLHMECNTGFDCRDGLCVEDPCFNISCEEGQVCDAGNCVFSACMGVTCPEGEQCGQNGCEPVGSCGDSVCVGDELCVEGQCVSPQDPSPGNNGTGNNDGENPNTNEGASQGPQEDSCQVSSGRPGSAWSLLFLLGLGLFLIRRNRNHPGGA